MIKTITDQELNHDDVNLLQKALNRIELLEKQLDEKDGKHSQGGTPTNGGGEKDEPPIVTPDGQKVPSQQHCPSFVFELWIFIFRGVDEGFSMHL